MIRNPGPPFILAPLCLSSLTIQFVR